MLNATINYLNTNIKEILGDFVPEIGIVLGSGLGELADEFCELAIPYSEIPGFEASQVSGHKSRLVFAEINGKKVIMMQGRFHFYEGHSIQKVVFPIKVMKKLVMFLIFARLNLKMKNRCENLILKKIISSILQIVQVSARLAISQLLQLKVFFTIYLLTVRIMKL